MAEPTRRRRHAAASGRILAAGVSSATALGMVAGMAVTAPAEPGREADSTVLLEANADPGTPPTAATPTDVTVVVRRHWIPVPADRASSPAPALPTPAPLLALPSRPATPVPPTAGRATAPPPKQRPVTRTRSS